MRLYTKITFGLVAVTVAAGAYIAWHHLGLIEGIDFGCGQYYYSDIPNWQDYFNGSHYKTQDPIWIYFALFFAWGGLMMWLWRKVDN